MKQGKGYIKLVLWIFLAAVVCYFGYYVFRAMYAPLTTAVAMEYEAGTGCYVSGFVVREEHIVETDQGITAVVVSEGERVSCGQVLATGYRNGNAQERQIQMEILEDQMEQLKHAASYSSDAANQVVLDGEIQAQIFQMNRYIARRDMNSAADRSASLKGLVLRRMSSEADNDTIKQRMNVLREQLDRLQAESQGDTTELKAQSNGYYSGTVDGYETVLTPAALETITMEELHGILPNQVPDNAVGKLISGSTWYYVTEVPEEQIEGSKVGEKIRIDFSSDFRGETSMEIVRIGDPANGSCLLVLSCDRYMQEATVLRQQSADIVFSSYSGLRVPKDAVRVDSEQHVGVYVLEGNMAAWKTIRILYDSGESYVVELDKSSTDHLWPGDEIIIGAKNLYDGKVVR